jgi:mannose-6-phosphate isomerase-like protein (cupin superfamily)
MTTLQEDPRRSPVSTDTAEHYGWGDGCDGWHLLRTAGASVIQERMPPGTSEDRHWHARSHQFFYLLAGSLDIELEGTAHRLTRGMGIEIPPGNAHRVSNDMAGDAEFLVVSVPPSHGDRHAAESAD